MTLLKTLPRSIVKAGTWLVIAAILLLYAPWFTEMEFKHKAFIFMGVLFSLIKIIGKEYDIKEATFETTKKYD